MVQTGRLKAIGVSWPDSTDLVPGVPGMKEAGLPDYSLDFWYGIFVPAGTHPLIVQKLFTAIKTAMNMPNVRSALAREGTDISVSASPQAFASFLTDDEKFWVKLVKDAQVKID